VIQGADVFIGVSAAGALTPKHVSLMKKNCMILAMANPIPEIMPDEAKKAGAWIVGTGIRSLKINFEINFLLFTFKVCINK